MSILQVKCFNPLLTTCFVYVKISYKEMIMEKFKIKKGVLFSYSGGKEKNVVIPEGVKEIGEDAFKNCNFIETVKIPDSVKVIGEGAFSHCLSLKEIEIPSSVEMVDEYAFFKCISLKNVIFHEGLKYLNTGAFSDCSSLENVVLPESIKDLGFYLFSDCKNLKSVDASKVTLNNKYLNHCMFEGCINLSKVVLPVNLVGVGTRAFKNCLSLKEIKFSENLKYMEDYVFGECESLKTIDIPNGVQKLGHNIFNGCSNLRNIYLPDSLISVGYDTFKNCYNSGSINLTIPKSLVDKDDYVVFKPFVTEFSAENWFTVLSKYPEILADNDVEIPNYFKVDKSFTKQAKKLIYQELLSRGDSQENRMLVSVILQKLDPETEIYCSYLSKMLQQDISSGDSNLDREKDDK